ncbi:MAG: hypothetical protein HDR09_18430 [Lachnospiraceae bacterium]|nr:hypothetical protein [Lachnospiraceae bacterium]
MRCPFLFVSCVLVAFTRFRGKGSGIAFTAELFLVTAMGAIAAQPIYLGTAGWDMPIQYIKIIAVAPMNMLQAEIYEYAYTLLGCAFIPFTVGRWARRLKR